MALFIINPLLHWIITIPKPGKIILMTLLLVPFSILIGIPFPLGLRTFLSGPHQRAYSWAINGTASVLTSIIAIPLAMNLGLSFVILAAGISYGIALLALVKNRSAIFL